MLIRKVRRFLIDTYVVFLLEAIRLLTRFIRELQTVHGNACVRSEDFVVVESSVKFTLECFDVVQAGIVGHSALKLRLFRSHFFL